MNICNLSCPIKHCKLRNDNMTWHTNGLRNVCRIKNNLYVKFKTNQTLYNGNIYKKYKNKLTNIMRNCEKQFYSIELEEKRIEEHGKY